MFYSVVSFGTASAASELTVFFLRPRFSPAIFCLIFCGPFLSPRESLPLEIVDAWELGRIQQLICSIFQNLFHGESVKLLQLKKIK
jgi:hypothetical protein